MLREMQSPVNYDRVPVHHVECLHDGHCIIKFAYYCNNDNVICARSLINYLMSFTGVEVKGYYHHYSVARFCSPDSVTEHFFYVGNAMMFWICFRCEYSEMDSYEYKITQGFLQRLASHGYNSRQSDYFSKNYDRYRNFIAGRLDASNKLPSDLFFQG